MNVFVAIDEFGHIYGIYEEYEDAWDRIGELSLEGVSVDLEQYVLNADVDFDSPS